MVQRVHLGVDAVTQLLELLEIPDGLGLGSDGCGQIGQLIGKWSCVIAGRLQVSPRVR